jgi:DNA (cytosine-5)-methyltransferase 1
MTHLSLFSGIGGIDLAAESVGFRTIAFCEREEFCQRVLAKHWPGVPIFDDICNLTAESVGLSTGVQPGEITLVSGGFPCQPHSLAGKRLASDDERDLWSEMFRVIGEVRPRWVVAENVPGLLSSESGRFFGRVLRDLASLGMRVGWGTYGAGHVGARHRRLRVFVVAHLARCGAPALLCSAKCPHEERWWESQSGGGHPGYRGSDGSWAPHESRMVGGVHGLSSGVDLYKRAKALGNCVVPAQVLPILQAVAAHEQSEAWPIKEAA